ncbi:MAG: response regulator [Capsulimonadales bacterium]|nr:response regulator [Capsulimonadales bacterium]
MPWFPGNRTISIPRTVPPEYPAGRCRNRTFAGHYEPKGASPTEQGKKPSGPAFPSAPETADATRNVPTPSLTGRRAVIVEDEGITRIQLRRTLTRAGIIVAGTAGDGQDGVEVVLRERPDLVLMDLNMPVMDGFEASRRILTQYPVCIVILTAYSLEEYERQAREIGVSAYLHKPIVSSLLYPQLERAWQAFRNDTGLAE